MEETEEKGEEEKGEEEDLEEAGVGGREGVAL